ncbi:uncharacterized protein FIBRA_07527 [Fibroporia radiculosa]|uniref:Uncharacterized protein n=1 Tax=Fibroporia radiculosa TaxID=599839 RepID=J4GER8_9APHY|nr:uncharacterized protein FIBRA_07527 [Fibroporia radiculosa]CCM05313.1 predicted protein [Fibroporia radiculosa]
MLPSYQPLSQQSSVYASSQSFSGLSYSDIGNGLVSTQPFSAQSSLQGLHNADPNSPETFKQNIQITLEHVARVQSLARSTLSGIEHAYHPGISPMQVAADAAALQQALQSLIEILRQTGVGALPIQAPDLANPPSEEQLMAESSRAIQMLYERHRRMQEGAGMVASLLGASEQVGKK